MFELNSTEPFVAPCSKAVGRRHISYKNYLNLGCGEIFQPDWLNMDIFPAAADILQRDLRQGFPLPPASIDLIYSSYFLHLLNDYDVQNFLRECFRCLRPGGMIRIVVPDEEVAAEKYLAAIQRQKNISSPSSVQKGMQQIGEEEKTKIGNWGLMNFLRKIREFSIRMVLSKKQYAQLQLGRRETSLSGVKSKFHFYSLSSLFKAHGFENIRRCSASESSVADWASFHLDLDISGKPHYQDSLYLEARKPLY